MRATTLEVEATLHPYQAEAQVVRLKVKLPDSLTPGPLRIVVSDGATVDRLTTPAVTGRRGSIRWRWPIRWRR